METIEILNKGYKKSKNIKDDELEQLKLSLYDIKNGRIKRVA